MSDQIPAYNFEGLLRLVGFATKTMLRAERRQPAEGQPAVGQYWSGHDWVMLYRAADAVDMPPLSPGRQRLYEKNRTCAMCGATSKATFGKGRDGNRYCGTCQRPAAERWWHQERDADRPAVVEWARGVLADPTACLAARERHQFWTRDLAVSLDGAVLLDVEIRYNLHEPREDHPQHEELVRRSPLAAIDKIEGLRGRRMISWWTTTAPDLATSFDEFGAPAARATMPERGDSVGNHYDRWVGEISNESGYLSPRPWLKQHRPPEGGAQEQIARMREILDEIAGGEKPADSAPGDPSGGEQ